MLDVISYKKKEYIIKLKNKSNSRKILIFGAGSIGNHMSYACSKLGFEVWITDKNQKALNRMKKLVYPKRYGKWNNKIKQINFSEINRLGQKFELVIIGTPPETHSKIYNLCIKKINFNKLLIEKPIFHVNEKKLNKLRKTMNSKMVFCGYNHSISPSFEYFNKYIFTKIDRIQKINVEWCESWDGILGAHFWLKNEFGSYLGDYSKGGGSLQEHSHGLHLLNLLLKKRKINLLNLKIYSNSIFFRGKKKYDILSRFTGYSQNIYISYLTDLITNPADKRIIIHGPLKRYEWICNYKKERDIIKIYKNNVMIFKKIFKKTRSSEFENEIKHIMNINKIKDRNNSNLNTDNAIDIVKFIKKFLTHEK